MVAPAVPLDDALAQARSGDLWLFRGRTVADRAIQAATNAPVNHVGLVVAVADLPPLLWHAALDPKLVDVWRAAHHRGAQLNRLEAAVLRWRDLGNRAWFRHLDPDLGTTHERRLLEVIDEYDGRSFPSPPRMARRWVAGRVRRDAGDELVYCAELAALTLTRMGLLPEDRPVNWYDPGRFWSGDRLELLDGYAHGPEVEVDLPTREGSPGCTGRWRRRRRRQARRHRDGDGKETGG